MAAMAAVLGCDAGSGAGGATGSSTATAAAPSSTDAAPSSTATAAASPPAVKQLRQHAQRALEAEKPRFVERCWTPSAGGPDQIKLVFELLFDADGKEIGRGVTEVRDMARPEVADCVRGLPLGLTIPPPGRPVELRVALLLP